MTVQPRSALQTGFDKPTLLICLSGDSAVLPNALPSDLCRRSSIIWLDTGLTELANPDSSAKVIVALEVLGSKLSSLLKPERGGHDASALQHPAYENSRLKLFRIQISPGEQTWTLARSESVLYYPLTPATLQFTLPDSTVSEINLEPGVPTWSGELTQRKVKNIGGVPADILMIELN